MVRPKQKQTNCAAQNSITVSPRHGLADNMPPAYRSGAAVTTQNCPASD
jgi:hypothetical protein